MSRCRLLAAYAADLVRFGLPETTGRMDREVLFILDGVGGFQAAPVMVRRALRELGSELGTVLFTWQYGLAGEIWTDLMWHRRNRLMGLKLARRLLAFRRSHPQARVHLLAFSGGAGVAVFGCEWLHRFHSRRSGVSASKNADRPTDRSALDTLILACPAISATYNLAGALRAVKRCYALVSRRDRIVLGLGTRIFGTVDRRFAPAAGLIGLRIPPGLSAEDVAVYQRLKEIRWSPALKKQGHGGGHTGWAGVPILRHYLPGLLRGEPCLPVHPVEPAEADHPSSGTH